MRAGACDIWNDGSYHGFKFGPTGKGNDLGVFDEDANAWMMVEQNSIVIVNVQNCVIDGVTGQSAQIGRQYLVGNIRRSGVVFVELHSITGGYVRADPDSGIMCVPYPNGKQRVTGMLYVHPSFGIQGQRHSQYLIGRHDLWTVGLDINPRADSVIPADSEWHELSGAIEFCKWADRLPTSPLLGAFNVFGSWVGQSLQVGIGQNAAEASGSPGAQCCGDVHAPVNITAQYTLNGGHSDGYISLKAFARCNGGTSHWMKVGHAYNSMMGIGIWF
jgi:hypothetical protein